MVGMMNIRSLEVAEKYNISTLMLLPMLNHVLTNVNQTNWFRDLGLIFAYSKDRDIETCDYCLHLLFKTNELLRPYNDGTYFEYMKASKGYVRDYSISGDRIMFVYEVDEKFHADYSVILNGDYSLVSENYRRLCSKSSFAFNITLKDPNILIEWLEAEDLLYGMYRGKSGGAMSLVKEGEVWVEPLEEKETFNYDTDHNKESFV